MRSGRSSRVAARRTADLQQLQAECLELADHSMQSRTGPGASRSAACPDRFGSRPVSGTLASSSDRSARGRGSHRRRVTTAGCSVLGGHAIRVGLRGVSAHHIDWVIRQPARACVGGTARLFVIRSCGDPPPAAGPADHTGRNTPRYTGSIDNQRLVVVRTSGRTSAGAAVYFSFGFTRRRRKAGW
jgi:hypothetical protein